MISVDLILIKRWKLQNDAVIFVNSHIFVYSFLDFVYNIDVLF